MPFKIGLAQKRKSLLEAELKRILPEIIELDVEKVILFGSLVSGSVHKASDLDIIIIKKTAQRFLDRLEQFYYSLQPRLAMDILVYTPEEFEEMSQGSLMRTLLRDGKVLYEK